MTNQEIVDTLNSAIAKAATILADGGFKNPERAVVSIAELCNTVRAIKGEEPLREPGETVEPTASETDGTIA
jgi:hypothetical protein